MNKTPKFFFDASIKNNILGIGINELYSGKEVSYQYIIEEDISSIEGEELAFNKAIEWALNEFPYIREYHFFNDNKMLYRKQNVPILKNKVIELFWVPRELNSIADKLADIKTFDKSKIYSGMKTISKIRHTPISDNIAKYISRKYSLSQRLSLLKKIALNEDEKYFLNNMFYTNVELKKELVLFYSLVSSFLLKEERPNCFLKIINFDGFKDNLKNSFLEKKLKLARF